jgi:hypothetical protein
LAALVKMFFNLPLKIKNSNPNFEL